MAESAAGTVLSPEIKELLLKKEMYLRRFLKLTEEALQKIKEKREEKLPLILEKRQKLIIEISSMENSLSAEEKLLLDNSVKISEIKGRILTGNKKLREQLEKNFLELKEKISNTKQALKINRHYQGNSGYSRFLNSRN